MIKISNAELEVMKVVWEMKRVTSLEIIEKLEHCKWNKNTVRTLLNRLVAKRAVGIAKKDGKTYTYVPLIKENEYKMKKSKEFLRQFYHGSIDEMLLEFIKNNELTTKELEILLKKISK